MNRTLVVIGVVIIVLGLLSIPYGRFAVREKSRGELGPITFEMPVERIYEVPRWVSLTGAALGVVLVAIGLGQKQSRVKSNESS